MALIDNEIINKIRNSINIVDVIGNYVPLSSKGRNFFGVCPFHDDHSPSMSVSPDKQIYTCFSCGATGNVFTFIQDYEHISFLEAVKKISLEVGINIGINIETNKKKNDLVEYNILNLAQKYFVNNLNSSVGLDAIEYLKKRKINNELIEKFGIGLALNENKNLSNFLINKGYSEDLLKMIGLINDDGSYDIFRNRIMFPIHDHLGQIVGYSGRIYHNEDQAKYVNSKSSLIFKKGEILYNYHLAKDEARKNKYVILVEGFMDVIRLSSVGINSAVALMGTALTNDQINLLKQLKTKVIVCLDNDEAGENATLSVGDQLLKAKIETYIIRLSDYKDPDEYISNKDVSDFKLNIDNAMNYLDYKIKYYKNNTKSNDSETNAKNINILIDTINDLSDNVLKEVMINKISLEFSIDINIIKSKLKLSEITTPEKEVVKPIIDPKLNKIEKSCIAIIYLMASDTKFIKSYEKKLGYLPIKIYNDLAVIIRNYYKKNLEINLADFISTISENEEYKTMFKKILMHSESINEENFEEYIKIINLELKRKRISELLIEIEKTNDLGKKIELTKKIADIKKEV